MNKFDLSQEQVNLILKQANRIPFNNVLHPKVEQILRIEGYVFILVKASSIKNL